MSDADDSLSVLAFDPGGGFCSEDEYYRTVGHFDLSSSSGDEEEVFARSKDASEDYSPVPVQELTPLERRRVLRACRVIKTSYGDELDVDHSVLSDIDVRAITLLCAQHRRVLIGKGELHPAPVALDAKDTTYWDSFYTAMERIQQPYFDRFEDQMRRDGIYDVDDFMIATQRGYVEDDPDSYEAFYSFKSYYIQLKNRRISARNRTIIDYSEICVMFNEPTALHVAHVELSRDSNDNGEGLRSHFYIPRVIDASAGSSVIRQDLPAVVGELRRDSDDNGEGLRSHTYFPRFTDASVYSPPGVPRARLTSQHRRSASKWRPKASTASQATS